MKWTDESPADALPAWDGESPATLRVLVAREVLAQVAGHLAAANVEQGGLLLGVAYVRGAGGGAQPGAPPGPDAAGCDVPHATAPDATPPGPGAAAASAEPCVVRLLAAVPAEQSRGDAISLRMDTPVWTAAAARLDALRAAQPHARIVGWYHSHPGIGAFFSRTDRRTQRAWFAHPYSVGWVIDPVKAEHAFFAGADARAVREAFVETARGAEALTRPA